MNETIAAATKMAVRPMITVEPPHQPSAVPTGPARRASPNAIEDGYGEVEYREDGEEAGAGDGGVSQG